MSPKRPAGPVLALYLAALFLLLGTLLLAAAPGARAATDISTCKAVADKLGGEAGLRALAPNCDPRDSASFRVAPCCSQLKKVLAASGPAGKACLCDPALFNQFVAMANTPQLPSVAIPFFLSTVCRIPIPGKGC